MDIVVELPKIVFWPGFNESTFQRYSLAVNKAIILQDPDTVLPLQMMIDTY
jgi:hypothetical protein